MENKTHSPRPMSHGNNADPHEIYRVAGAYQRKALQRFLYLMHHVIEKQVYRLKTIHHQLVYQYAQIYKSKKTFINL